jgi:hypothetical protein
VKSTFDSEEGDLFTDHHEKSCIKRWGCWGFVSGSTLEFVVS